MKFKKIKLRSVNGKPLRESLLFDELYLVVEDMMEFIPSTSSSWKKGLALLKLPTYDIVRTTNEAIRPHAWN